MRNRQFRPPDDSSGSEPDLTIDELAHRAGIATSTVRLYQTKGLLPPPTKRGRVGYYGSGHLARLRLIGQLQAGGFSLAGIGALVSAWESGRTLDDVLGLEAEVAAAASPTAAPLRLSPADLATWFPDGSLTGEVIAKTLALGLLEVDGDQVVIREPRFLELGSNLARLGIPVGEILDEYGRLHEDARNIANRFVRLFADHLWPDFTEGELPPDDLRSLTETLRDLRRAAEAVTVLTLRRSLAEAAGIFVADRAKNLETNLPDVFDVP